MRGREGRFRELLGGAYVSRGSGTPAARTLCRRLRRGSRACVYFSRGRTPPRRRPDPCSRGRVQGVFAGGGDGYGRCVIRCARSC